jgi:L-seryl-tRNA(Ser) seleniumtransferase
MNEAKALLRDLPSIDRLLSDRECAPLLHRFNRAYVTQHCRRVLDELRASIRAGQDVRPDQVTAESVLARVQRAMEADSQLALTPVVNATGTVLHTNFGRAVLAELAIEALCRAARHPITLEYDLGRHGRGRREDVIEELLADLTGAEAATVVNNNAAAVLLALNTLAESKEAIVSRGELIEIGGSFRIPEIMAKSGAILKEVGTTNRTHIADYETAIGDRTGLLLKVHTSNYRIVGFTSDVGLPELVDVGRRCGVPVMEDLGSGALVDLSEYGLPKEPVVAERVQIGADVVTFSGDKLLGGPQAGLIVGKNKWVNQIRQNPLHRALRCSKLTIAALEATLRLYLQAPNIVSEIPTLQALTRPVEQIDQLGAQTVPRLQEVLGKEFRVSLESSGSQVGSGALPAEEIPTKVIVIEGEGLNAEKIASRFRAAHPPIIGRIKDGRFLLDLRSIVDSEDLIPRWKD